jgi:hypothetical protein
MNKSNKIDIGSIEPSFLAPIKLNSNREYQYVNKNKWHWLQVTLACVIKMMLSIIAASLVWSCNSKENILFRIVLTILAIMFSEIYILYYAVYRVYMGNKCNI